MCQQFFEASFSKSARLSFLDWGSTSRQAAKGS